MRRISPRGSENASILIVGDKPDEISVKVGMAFAGATGSELQRLLMDAGIHSSDYRCMYIVPYGGCNMDAMTGDGWEDNYLLELNKELLTGKIKVIIGLGGTVLRLLAGKDNIDKMHGSELEWIGVPFVPTYAIEDTFKDRSRCPFVIADFKRAYWIANGKHKRIKQYKWQWLSEHEVIHELEMFDRNSHVAVDVEIGNGTVVCIAIANRNRSICIPFMNHEGPVWTADEQLMIKTALDDLFKRCPVIGQNFNHDKKWIEQELNVHVNCSFDTMVAEQVLNPGGDKDLASLASLYCDDYVQWKQDAKGWWKEKSATDYQRLYEYNCKDAATTFEIGFKQLDELMYRNLMPQFVEQMELQKCLFAMEQNGIRVDRARTTELKRMITSKKKELLKSIEEELRYKLNPQSSKQVYAYVYGQLKKKRLRNPTSMDSLMRYSDDYVVSKIIEYRKLTSIRTKFLDEPVDQDGRRRYGLNGCGDAAFRVTNSGGLNHVMHSNELRYLPLDRFREHFIPDDGHYLFSASFRSAEQWVIAWEIDDQRFKDWLCDGCNIYYSLSLLFLANRTGVTQEQREAGRDICERLIKGRTVRSIALEIGLKDRDVLAYRKWLESLYPLIFAWHQRINATLIGTKTVRNVYGYVLQYIDRLEGALPKVIEWIVQSTIALTMTRIQLQMKQLHGVDMLLRTFDNELIYQYNRCTFGHEIETVMNNKITYVDPLVLPYHVKLA